MNLKINAISFIVSLAQSSYDFIYYTPSKQSVVGSIKESPCLYAHFSHNRNSSPTSKLTLMKLYQVVVNDLRM